MTHILELLNTAAQPTWYERRLQRAKAIELLRRYIPEYMQIRLEGRETKALAQNIETLRTKYNITDEEIYECSAS